MNNLLLINETFTNGYRDKVLDIISLASILSGIFVIISKNPVVSVLFLIGLFLSIACYLLILGINFIGLSYLLVYVGAVSILFLFILMLINVRVSELLSVTSNSIPLAVVIAVSFNYPLYLTLPVNSTSSAISLNKLYLNYSDYLGSYSTGLSTYISNNDQISFVSSDL